MGCKGGSVLMGGVLSLNIRGKGSPWNLNIGRFPDAFVSFVRFSFLIPGFVQKWGKPPNCRFMRETDDEPWEFGVLPSILETPNTQQVQPLDCWTRVAIRSAKRLLELERPVLQLELDASERRVVRRLGGWFEATGCGNLATQQRDLTSKYRTRQQSLESYWLYKSDSPAPKWDDDPNWMVYYSKSRTFEARCSRTALNGWAKPN